MDPLSGYAVGPQARWNRSPLPQPLKLCRSLHIFPPCCVLLLDMQIALVEPYNCLRQCFALRALHLAVPCSVVSRLHSATPICLCSK